MGSARFGLWRVVGLEELMMGHGFGMGSGRTWGKDGRGGMSTDVFRWGGGGGEGDHRRCGGN